MGTGAGAVVGGIGGLAAGLAPMILYDLLTGRRHADLKGPAMLAGGLGLVGGATYGALAGGRKASDYISRKHNLEPLSTGQYAGRLVGSGLGFRMGTGLSRSEITRAITQGQRPNAFWKWYPVLTGGLGYAVARQLSPQTTKK